jgi:hypothetical protein
LQTIRKSLGDKLNSRIAESVSKNLLQKSQVDLTRPRFADKKFNDQYAESSAYTTNTNRQSRSSIKDTIDD